MFDKRLNPLVYFVACYVANAAVLSIIHGGQFGFIQQVTTLVVSVGATIWYMYCNEEFR